ncbi:chemotaxis protein CheA [Roseibacterium sp. SDUM158017]|uniref:chemotaxis protein CheA n=1 Tax=Roseicyclus salinarum TaxID=3036773 RepID=UPI00241549B9|nr:chemotaxis protein CheA [Roseibacterium sp. SDUM158017]MDG4649240.1 chemotaxis protein CheA [Roseibacterium sp. SDUM158017]
MSGLDELRVSFFQECEDLLDSLGEGLREMSEDGEEQDIETVHAVFRAVHSIKGGAGAFGLDDLVTFAHLFETVLDQMRCGKMATSESVMRTLLRAGDMLSDLVFCARDERAPEESRLSEVLAELDALADGHGEDDEALPFEFVPSSLSIGPIEAAEDVDDPMIAEGESGTMSGPAEYRIHFKPKGELYGTGNEPLALFRALDQMGTLAIEADTSGIASLADFGADQPGLSWTLLLETEAAQDEIEAVFEFVTDLADVSIRRAARPENADTPHLIPATAPPNLEDGPPAPSLLAADAREAPARDEMAGNDPPSEAAPTPDAPTAVAASATAFAGVDAGPDQRKPKAAAGMETGSATAPPATIRVNLDRVDRLINLIGELVIMESMLSQAVENAGLAANSDVSNGLDGIKQLASGIQESVMAIRAQPLKPVFQRMHRIIREAADATGKQVRLIANGEATEVDKTVIERLVDPLTHMIRNSVDHGLEDAAVRIAAGKPETGTITLSAAHRSGRVIIEVSDDGAGINREKVREIAEAKGLVAPGTSLTPAEIDNLLFTPGFSSKEEVSALSGRGVGLDVVRREIQALGGRVTIQSVSGEGTTFTIALPLTLAVLEGMLVEFGGEMMVLPLSAILETLRPSSATIHSIGRTGRVVANRGELIPIIDLADAFGIKKPGDTAERDVLLLVECEAGRRAALAVDMIHDQRQVVIKSLEENYGAIPGISAATILGDGRIALIVDPEEIIASAAPDLPAPPLAANE